MPQTTSSSSTSNGLHPHDINGSSSTCPNTTNSAPVPNNNSNSSTTTTPNNKHHSNVTADDAQRCFPHHLHHVHHRSRSSSSAAASSRSRSASNASVTTTSSTLLPVPQSSCSSTNPATTPESIGNNNNNSIGTTAASNSSSSSSPANLSSVSSPHHSVSTQARAQPPATMISTPQHPSQSAATTTTPQSLNLMNPTTPQQRITIEKLLLIPPESVQSRNPKLYDLLIQLRRQYLWQAVTTPVVTTTTTATNNKDCGMHPLEKMKQEDAMVFASHIDEICNCVNNLLDELNEEEYELGSTVGYRARWLQEEELKVRAKVNAIAAPNDESEMLDPMHEDEEFEEDVEDVEEEEGIEGGDEDHHVISNPTSVTSSECVETHGTNTEHLGLSTSSAPVVACAEQSSTPEQQQDEYDEEDSEMIDNEETESSSLSNNINAQSQDGSSSKLQDFFRQLETVEPIPNGKLSFFQNHHLVVGKFDRQALVQNNILSCTVMKKSTLNVVVHRRCTRLRNDTDVNSRFTPFDATSGNYHDRRILKKQALAKSVVRFAKVKVDFGSIVEQVLQSQNQHSLPFSANLLSALGTFSTSNSTQSQQ